MKEKRQIMPRLLIALIASMTVMAAGAADTAGSRPRLVVGIVIDGLDEQYIDLLRDNLTPGGFNRLMRDGVVLSNVDYGTNLDATAATAMLVTGAAPSTTGITAAEQYNREALRCTPVLLDEETVGKYTSLRLSPRKLPVSTLADEVRIAGGGVTRAFGIAPDAQQAILLAGHSGSAALWIDDENGNWASSGHYTDIPASVPSRNRTASLNLRLDTVVWSPLLPAEAYATLPDHVTRYPFKYIFARGTRDRYDKFKSSAMVNREVTDVAGRIIDELSLGTADGIDMLNVAYTLQPFDYTISDDNRYELLDSYLRLDRNLEQLMAKTDSITGGNVLYMVAATPPTARSRRDDPRWGIPYGEFSTKKAKSLLNMYLMAVYGNGEWISSFHGGQFFLNHKLIGDLNLDAADVRRQAAAFLAKMTGIDHVYTLDEVLANNGDARLQALQRNNHPSTAGDLYIEVDPGWEVVDDITSPAPADRVHYVKRIASATAPVVIMYHELKPQLIATPVDARVVAPTVARLLRIRSPNGAALPALVL